MRGTVLLLVAALLIKEAVTVRGSENAVVFDVTTVHRLLKEGSTFEEKGVVEVPRCYLNGNLCPWTTVGWNHSDSNYAFAPYPVEVHGDFISTSTTEPRVIAVPAQKFAIDVRPSLASSKVYVILTAEKDIELSDMLVLEMQPGQAGSAYCCSLTIGGSHVVPSFPQRRCFLLARTPPYKVAWNTTSYQSFSVETSDGNVRVVSMLDNGMMLETYLPETFKELAGNVNFVSGIITSGGALKYSVPVEVLALARRRGTVKSPILVTGAHLLCVQLTTYLHPDSGAKLDVSVLFENSTRLHVGYIQPSSDEVVHWRFMSHFNSNEEVLLFNIEIEATKTNTKPVVLSGITTCNSTGVLGNLVFKTPEPGEVHLRTNARGLPVRLPDDSILSPSLGVKLPHCSPTSQSCEWTLNNFTQAREKNLRPLLDIGKSGFFVDLTTLNKLITQPRRFENYLKFSYKVSRSDSPTYSRLGIYLMDDQRDVLRSNMYYLDIRHVNYGSSQFYKCTSEDGSSQVSTIGGGSRLCTSKVSHSFGTYFSTGSRYFFALQKTGNQISVTSEQGSTSTVLFTFTDSNPIEVTYFAIGTDRLEGTIDGVNEYKTFSLQRESGSLVSPPLPPSLGSVCVSLVYYAEPDAVVELMLEEEKTLSLLGTLHSKKVAAYSDKDVKDPGIGQWFHKSIVVNVPNAASSKRNVVVMATKNDGALFLVQWVGGCNAEGSEDVVVLPEGSPITAIDVPQMYSHSMADLEPCDNGGLREPLGLCICPPGFSGKTCSEGCGPNSFGSDCGAVCSESAAGCRGMALCHPLLGCNCAPGFEGHLCSTPCKSGEYGDGCRQRCGNCVGETCDAFTGVCHQGCKTGHYPPFCHHVYAYISKAPTVVASGFSAVNVTADLLYFHGRGRPLFYQIQCKEHNETVWRHETPQRLPEGGMAKDTVTGLRAGSSYVLRVVLIDESLSSYEGSRVLITGFSMPCIVPTVVDYEQHEKRADALQMKVTQTWTDGFEVEWKVPHSNSTWCHLIGYELHMKSDWRWSTLSVPSDVTRRAVRGLRAGTQFTLKIRAVTDHGAAAFSQPLTVSTSDDVPDHVVNLRMAEATAQSLKFMWDPPKQPAGRIRRYMVEYQCRRLGACPDDDCSASAGQMEVAHNSILLNNLLPYALYDVSVRGIAGSPGPVSSIRSATSLANPSVSPSSVDPTVVSRTNSSLNVQWGRPDSCRQLNGYLTGYRYELHRPGQASPLIAGTTTDRSASFDDLKPHTEYKVHVQVVNSNGCNAQHTLVINAKTRATTPEVVEDLTVYKRGRRMLGVRWAAPRLSYGSLESFTVTHREAGASARRPVSVTVRPTPCPAWPRLFCHDVKNLKPDADYVIAVQARNSEVPEDGEEVAIEATTKEGAPSAPSFLRVVNQTRESISFEWGLPYMVNGQLRSFLVNVEETDSHNSSDCCQYFPIKEVIVDVERLSYEFTMTGLKAASSYEVGVTAKTVSLGPAVSLTAHTRPPGPVLTQGPKLEGPAVAGGPVRVHVESAGHAERDLASGYMLLLEGDTFNESSPISDNWLAAELKRTLNGSFSLAAEFSQTDLPQGTVVELHPGRPAVEGIFGTVGLPSLLPDARYRPVWVLVSEYCGTLSMGHVAGETFTVARA